MTDFVDKYGPWAVVTGASGGIGEALSQKLAEKGLNIVLVARREEKTTSISNSISSKYGVNCRVVTADLATSEGRDDVAQQTEDLDVGLLVNNAGIENHGSFFRDSLEKHLKIVEVNSTAPTALAYIFGHRLIKRRKGGIIFISSTASNAVPWMSTYSASKAFASTLAYTLRHELEPWGINVLAVEPNLVQTDMTEGDYMNLPWPYSSPEEVATATIDAFEKGVLRITPGEPVDSKGNAELKSRLDVISNQMKTTWDPIYFEP